MKKIVFVAIAMILISVLVYIDPLKYFLAPSSKKVAVDKTVALNKVFFNTLSLNQSIFRFSCTVYKKDGTVEGCWESHSFLYANRGDASYLAIPRHSFNLSLGDTTRYYDLQITNQKGERTKLRCSRQIYSNNYDAEILLIQKIYAPALSNDGKMTDQVLVGDTSIILSPFGQRNIPQKIGFLLGGNRAEMNLPFGESGDSGCLVVGRDGVLGVMVSISSGGRVVSYVPLEVFESLYVSLTMRKE